MPVLVLGPRGLLKDKPAVSFGKPASSKPVGDSLRQRLEDLAFSAPESRRLFFHQYADALAAGDVEAVLVELKRPRDGGGAGGPSGSGAGQGGAIGRPGGADGPGAEGAGPARNPLLGIPVPLNKAVPRTRERFLKLIGDPADGSQPEK